MKRLVLFALSVLLVLFSVIGQAGALDQIDASGLENSAPDELGDLDLNSMDLLGNGLSTLWESARVQIPDPPPL